jgi:hypothetical protein
MQRPPIDGIIDRRLLVNYRVDPETAQHLIPAPFRPQLVNGFAVAGICLLRMTELRPHPLPKWMGLRSENAAHRVAVEWDDETGTKSGVFIPRRDSGSLANSIVGGRVYPGVHHRARFRVSESTHTLDVRFVSNDGSAHVEVTASVADHLEESQLFDDLEDASRFFQRGNVGYSATKDPERLDGLEFHTTAWSITPATATHVRSSFFEDQTLIRPDAASLDCVLLMRQIPVSWTALPSLRTGNPSYATDAS